MRLGLQAGCEFAGKMFHDLEHLQTKEILNYTGVQRWVGGVKKCFNLYLLYMARGEGGCEDVTNPSPVIILNSRHWVIQISIQTYILEGQSGPQYKAFCVFTIVHICGKALDKIQFCLWRKPNILLKFLGSSGTLMSQKMCK